MAAHAGKSKSTNKLFISYSTSELQRMIQTKQTLVAFLEARYDTVHNMASHEEKVYYTTRNDIKAIHIELVRRAQDWSDKSLPQLEKLAQRLYAHLENLQKIYDESSMSDDEAEGKPPSDLARQMLQDQNLLEALWIEMSLRHPQI